MKIGYIGLGKMGYNMVLRLHEKGHEVLAYNRSPEPRERIGKEIGIRTTDALLTLKTLPAPRLVWVMLPEGAVDEALEELLLFLRPGDTIIDGGNSFYKNTLRRARELEAKKIHFLDAGVSGGPWGARNGACIMVGGQKEVFEKYEGLFKDLSGTSNRSNVLKNIRTSRGAGRPVCRDGHGAGRGHGYAHVGASGAGHFVKMVHNGIEYGMMQSIAEGFSILRHADIRGPDADRFDKLTASKRGKRKSSFDLKEIARLYNNGSVIESRLVGWLASAYEKHGADLVEISGTVAHTGEGEWTVAAARELGVPAPIIEASFQFRVASAKHQSYAGRVLSALRNQFGGHDIQ